MTQAEKLTYSKAKKGDMIFYPMPGVSYKASQAAILEKQPPNAIMLMDVGTQKIHVMSEQQFNEAGFMNVTSEMIVKEVSDGPFINR